MARYTLYGLIAVTLIVGLTVLTAEVSADDNPPKDIPPPGVKTKQKAPQAHPAPTLDDSEEECEGDDCEYEIVEEEVEVDEDGNEILSGDADASPDEKNAPSSNDGVPSEEQPKDSKDDIPSEEQPKDSKDDIPPEEQPKESKDDIPTEEQLKDSKDDIPSEKNRSDVEQATDSTETLSDDQLPNDVSDEDREANRRRLERRQNSRSAGHRSHLPPAQQQSSHREPPQIKHADIENDPVVNRRMEDSEARINHVAKSMEGKLEQDIPPSQKLTRNDIVGRLEHIDERVRELQTVCSTAAASIARIKREAEAEAQKVARESARCTGGSTSVLIESTDAVDVVITTCGVASLAIIVYIIKVVSVGRPTETLYTPTQSMPQGQFGSNPNLAYSGSPSGYPPSPYQPMSPPQAFTPNVHSPNTGGVQQRNVWSPSSEAPYSPYRPQQQQGPTTQFDDF